MVSLDVLTDTIDRTGSLHGLELNLPQHQCFTIYGFLPSMQRTTLMEKVKQIFWETYLNLGPAQTLADAMEKAKRLQQKTGIEPQYIEITPQDLNTPITRHYSAEPSLAYATINGSPTHLSSA